jgi:hypothetical protein
MKKRQLLAILVLTLAACVMADSTRGIRPRSKPSEYPVFEQQKTVSIGAEQLSEKQVKNSFASELNGHYIVVEVGVYPGADNTLEVAPDQFMLRIGTTSLVRPASPETVAAVLQKKPSSGHDVTLYPTTGVGYESGGTDINGNRRRGGWVTDAGLGVGVGSGGTPVASTPADRKTMETELRDKSLPQGKVSKSVAGYLYFPVSAAKNASFRLEYNNNDQSIKMALPKPVQ